MSSSTHDKNSQYYLEWRHPIRLTKRSQGDEDYWVGEIPDLPGCMAHGATPGEAVEELQETKRLWIETQLEDGYEIPEPFEPYDYSGKLLLRMPKSIHRRLAEDAHREGVSVNQNILSKLADKLGGDGRLRDFHEVVQVFAGQQEEFNLRQQEFAQKQEEFNLRQQEFAQKQEEFNLRQQEFAQKQEEFNRKQEELAQKMVTAEGMSLDSPSYRIQDNFRAALGAGYAIPYGSNICEPPGLVGHFGLDLGLAVDAKLVTMRNSPGELNLARWKPSLTFVYNPLIG